MQTRKGQLVESIRLSAVDHGVILKVLFTLHLETTAHLIVEWMIMDSVALVTVPQIPEQKN